MYSGLKTAGWVENEVDAAWLPFSFFAQACLMEYLGKNGML